jgi:hypothetical protein
MRDPLMCYNTMASLGVCIPGDHLLRRDNASHESNCRKEAYDCARRWITYDITILSKLIVHTLILHSSYSCMNTENDTPRHIQCVPEVLIADAEGTGIPPKSMYAGSSYPAIATPEQGANERIRPTMVEIIKQGRKRGSVGQAQWCEWNSEGSSGRGCGHVWRGLSRRWCRRRG